MLIFYNDPVETTKAKQIITLVFQGINHFLWPAVCINCNESICETEERLCQNCWSELIECTGANYCQRCGREVSKYAIIENKCPRCMGEEIYFDQIARSCIYSNALRKMTLAFKFSGKCELDAILGPMVKTSLEESSFYSDIDFLVPVPMHWTRKLSRGYNQSMLITKKLKHNSAKISSDLVRIRKTKAQAQMKTPAARIKNISEAFAVRKKHPFKGKNICLVDDIKTTGATLNECAKTLKNAGAVKVFAMVLAVAGQYKE